MEGKRSASAIHSDQDRSTAMKQGSNQRHRPESSASTTCRVEFIFSNAGRYLDSICCRHHLSMRRWITQWLDGLGNHILTHGWSDSFGTVIAPDPRWDGPEDGDGGGGYERVPSPTPEPAQFERDRPKELV